MDTIYFLTEYNWKPGELIPSKSVKNYKIKDSFGRIVMIPKEKCAFPDELVCVVWEMWKGRNGRGGYRVERQLYPEHRIAANMIERQNEFNLHGRVVENSYGVLFERPKNVQD